jgi:hypothetical protein
MCSEGGTSGGNAGPKNRQERLKEEDQRVYEVGYLEGHDIQHLLGLGLGVHVPIKPKYDPFEIGRQMDDAIRSGFFEGDKPDSDGRRQSLSLPLSPLSLFLPPSLPSLPLRPPLSSSPINPLPHSGDFGVGTLTQANNKLCDQLPLQADPQRAMGF